MDVKPSLSLSNSHAAVEVIPILLMVGNPVAQPLEAKTLLRRPVQRLKFVRGLLRWLPELAGMLRQELRVVIVDVGDKSWDAVDDREFGAT